MGIVVWMYAKDDKGLEILDRMEQEIGQMLVSQGTLREYFLSPEAAEGIYLKLDELDLNWPEHLSRFTD